MLCILNFADNGEIMTFGHAVLFDFKDTFLLDFAVFHVEYCIFIRLQVGTDNLLISDLIHLFNSSQNHVCVVSNVVIILRGASETQ